MGIFTALFHFIIAAIYYIVLIVIAAILFICVTQVTNLGVAIGLTILIIFSVAVGNA